MRLRVPAAIRMMVLAMGFASCGLVVGAGVYGVPAHAPYPARVANDARIDLMKGVDGGRTLSIGIGKRGISFGGAW